MAVQMGRCLPNRITIFELRQSLMKIVYPHPQSFQRPVIHPDLFKKVERFMVSTQAIATHLLAL
jgi:hypothetical protein